MYMHILILSLAHTVIEVRGLLRKENAPFDTYVKVNKHTSKCSLFVERLYMRQ